MLRLLQWWPAGKTASPSFLCNVGLSLVELMLRLHATFAFQLHAHLLDSCIAHDIPSAANCNRATSKDTSGKARAARNYIAQIFEIAGRSTDCRKQVRAKYKGGARGFAARRKKKTTGPRGSNRHLHCKHTRNMRSMGHYRAKNCHPSCIIPSCVECPCAAPVDAGKAT